MKKILIISFLIIIILTITINISYAVTPVTEEALQNSLNKLSTELSKSSDDDNPFATFTNIRLDSANKKIKITTQDGDIFDLSYDLSEKPTFSSEVLIQKGMSYENFEKLTQNCELLPIIGYVAVANTQGVEIEDALTYFMYSYFMASLDKAFDSNNSLEDGYIIVDDLNLSEGVTIEKSDDSKTIYTSEFGDKVIEYVNATYKNKQSISDNLIDTNSYLSTIEKIDISDTSCKLVSQLSVNLDANFTEIIEYINNIKNSSSNDNIPQEDQTNFFEITLKEGQKCKIKSAKQIKSITFHGNKDSFEFSSDNTEITATAIGGTMFAEINVEEKNIILLILCVGENTEGTSLETITYDLDSGTQSTSTPNIKSEVLPNTVLIIPPTQTIYDIGENLNLDGLKITAVYDDNIIKEIKNGYTVKGYNKNKEGIQTVTISYEGFSRSYEVKVGDVSYRVDKEGKLPQTGNFPYLQTGLYVLISLLSLILISLVYKSFKYRK